MDHTRYDTPRPRKTAPSAEVEVVGEVELVRAELLSDAQLDLRVAAQGEELGVALLDARLQLLPRPPLLHGEARLGPVGHGGGGGGGG